MESGEDTWGVNWEDSFEEGMKQDPSIDRQKAFIERARLSIRQDLVDIRLDKQKTTPCSAHFYIYPQKDKETGHKTHNDSCCYYDETK